MTNDNSVRAQVAAIRQRDPNASASDIAAEIGASRQYVYLIFDELGLKAKVGGYRPRKQAALPEARIITGGVSVRITHTTAGTIGELLVAADLMARGFTVFHPLVRSAALCDLIAQNRETSALERIEVRCGKRTSESTFTVNPPDKSNYDRLAIVLTGEIIKYTPPFPDDKS